MNPTSIQPDWSNKTYLVIDDFSIVHRMLRDMLRKLGAVAIDTVKNGADAITLLREKHYDVVLCDYNFSEGPNGQQILEEARHRELIGLTCIWIMVSSEKAVETVMGAAEQAPDGYILKPLTESLLLARLNRAWDRKQAFTAIERAYGERNYLKAANLCDQRLATAPLHAMDLLRMKASLLLKAGQPQQARQVYEQVLAIREQVWAKAGLARIDCLEGHYHEAMERLQDIVSEHPSFLDAYDQLAQALQQLGENEQALAVLEQAAQLSPYSVVRQKNLGDMARQLGRFELAEQAYQTSIAVGEYSILKSPDAYLGLAQLYSKAGRLQEAQTLLATARQSFPNQDFRLPSEPIASPVSALNSAPGNAPSVCVSPENTSPEKSAISRNKLQQQANSRDLASTPAGAANATPIPAPTSTPTSKPTAVPVSTAVSIPTAASRTPPSSPNIAERSSTPATTAPQSSAAIAKQAPVTPVPNQPPSLSATLPPIDSSIAAAADQFALSPPGATQDTKDTASAIPAPALALYQRAQVLLQYMKTNGYNMVSAEEVRAVLKRAEKLAPATPRTQELLSELQSLATAGRK